MKSIFFTIGLCFVLLSSATGQTSADLSQRFTATGKPGQFRYAGILLTTEYDREGQICRVLLPSEAFPGKNIVSPETHIEGQQLQEILDLLAPPESRERVKPELGLGWALGAFLLQPLYYGNVTVSTYHRFRFGKARKSSPPAPPKPSESADPAGTRLVVERLPSADSAVIFWPSRNCID